LRNEIVWAMRTAIEASARDRVKQLAKVLRDAQTINEELYELRRYDLFPIPASHWPELSRLNEYSRLNQWLASAREAGWDV
jgi:hypothetical protein